MLSSSVSGILMNQRTKTGPDIHKISQRDHLQTFAVTAKPDNKGPRAGALKPADTQNATAIGTYNRLYMSCIVAGPVAKHGLPKKPCKNRRNNNPPRSLTKAVGTDSITNKANVTI